VHLPNRCVTESHLSHFVISSSWPENFYLLTLRVSDNLTANICLVSLIKDINSKIYNHVSEINFFIRGQSHLLDSESFTTSNTRSTSQYFFNISWLRHMIPRGSHLTI
jgi:hypothetical protein